MSDARASRVGSMFGPYHLKRLLGSGGMGEVYEAEHTVKEWTVAVKVMSEQFSKDPVFRERMKREARITGRLPEPHVVPIHDYGEIDGQIYLEMRLIDGIDLDSMLKRFGPLTPPRAVAIITQIASALDAAHAAGVMHRDVKPPNILLTRDDFAYLVDFGIASASTDEKLTQLGTAVGTWKYMAPERFSNDEVTYRADIYALACVLYECLTGSPPYRADSAATLVTAHLMEDIPRPSAVRSSTPRSLDAVIARGMAKKPEDRYPSAGDLALAAHEALSNPDQDRADTILQRSEEATVPVAPTPAGESDLADTALAAPPPLGPTINTPPPSPADGSPTAYPAASGGPTPSATAHRWTPSSGPMPAPAPQHYSGGSTNWGGPPANTPPPFPGPAPWNQGQPPPQPKRSPWPIIAAIAAVLIVVVGGVGIWLVAGSSAPPPRPPADPISSERLSALLLNPAEINAVMGSSTMQPGKPLMTLETTPLTLSLPDCQGAVYTSQAPVYTEAGYTAVSGLVSSEPGDNYDHWVHQAVVLFPSADKAKSFLETSAEKWKGCAGKTVTITNRGKTFRWTLAQINGSPPKIAVHDTEEAADGWQCQHALAAANNVVADIDACGYRISNQGEQIVDKIVDKINTE